MVFVLLYQQVLMSSNILSISILLFPGCIKGAEVVNIQVKLHDLQLTGSISPALYSAAASDCVRACLRHGDCTLLQPMMRVEVNFHEFLFFIRLLSSRLSVWLIVHRLS
jgi:hypothetical protein